MKKRFLFLLSLYSGFLFAADLPEGVIDDNPRSNSHEVKKLPMNEIKNGANSTKDKEVQDALDTISLLGKATRDAEIAENPNVITKTLEEIEKEKKLNELNGYNKSLLMIKDYLNEFKNTLVLKKVITNVNVAFIKEEKLYIESKLVEQAISELDTNVRQYKAIKAQISLIEKTIATQNFKATEIVYNAFSNILSQITSSVNLSGNASMSMMSMGGIKSNEAPVYNEYKNGDKVGTDIYLKKIDKSSVEIYYKG